MVPAAGHPRATSADTALTRRYLHYLRLAGPPVLMFLIGMWGISGASFWRDEAATLSATRRPLGALWRMLSGTDVVHGIYYVLILPWTRIAGTSELALRLPSLLGMSVAAAGVAAIGARLLSERPHLGSVLCGFPCGEPIWTGGQVVCVRYRPCCCL